MGLVSELKRRNVLRMAALYVVAAWLIMQVAEVVISLANLPDWSGPVVLVALAIGFPIALVFSWIYELTPEGLALEKEVEPGESITHVTGRRIDFLVISILAAAVIMFAIDKWWQPSSDQSIAVLPFENLSADPDHEYFTNGFHDELLTRLSQVGALKVISRTSVMPYRNSAMSLPAIASELSVGNIVEGSVQRIEDRVRINVQLIDASTDEHLWADVFDRELSARNMFEVQSSTARSIASTLHATLSSSDDRALTTIHTENMAAYDAYLAGLNFLDRASNLDTQQAAENFVHAVELDPEFALAWASLCEAQLSLYTIDSNIEQFELAEAACSRALELDDSQPEVHIASALLYSYRGQYAHAEVSLRQADFARSQQLLSGAGDVDRLSTRAQIDLGKIYALQGRISEAERTLQRAADADPRNWRAQLALFSFYYSDSDLPDRFELATTHASAATALRPDIPQTWNNLGAANFMNSSYEQAADAWAQAARIEPNRTTYTNSGLALYYTRRFDEAAEMQQMAIELAPDDHRSWGRLGDALLFGDTLNEQAKDAYATATSLARKQLEINDQDWQTWGLLSVYLAVADMKDESLNAAERAIEISARNSESLYYASIVELLAGRPDACLDYLHETVTQDPSYRELISIEPFFDEISDSADFQTLITTP